MSRSATKSEPAEPATVEFSRDIAPILQSRCIACHGAAKQKGGLRLDEKNSALRGGDAGPAIIPGKSDQSPLFQRVTSKEKSNRMPATGSPLDTHQIALLKKWIDQGANWPVTVTGSGRQVETHWAFRPLTRPAMPTVANTTWPRSPIDNFILARLERDSLHPSAPADRRTLLRRLKFDLLGLPPTPAEVDAFLADANPDAYERLVERLLQSPQYGERWARHWLDVVRFAESDGFEMNQARANAWPYRDYVIRAFNTDKPYDRFVQEQIAGDALGADEATGFLVGGAWDRVKSPDVVLTAQQRADELHDMVGTTGSAFLGLTVGCARCHNHKFDPISQLDYYGIKAVFAGVQHGERSLRPAMFEKGVRDPDDVRRDITGVTRELQNLEPKTRPQRVVVLDDFLPTENRADSAAVTQLVPRAGVASYPAGRGRGQLHDPGDHIRHPNLGRSYSQWRNVAGKDVLAWRPQLSGKYRVWLSWSCSQESNAPDARYILDRDGDLRTETDQVEMARVDQRRFADGTQQISGEPLWSGLFDAGVHELGQATVIVLRGGDSAAPVTADVLVLQRQESTESSARLPLPPPVRMPVTRQRNVERFEPVTARSIRFTILETNQSEPCIDELEVFTAEMSPRNVALAGNRTRATASGTLAGFPIHKLEHINDGQYGNNRSWISNQSGKGWVQLDFPQEYLIDTIAWSRDRGSLNGFTDRIPTRYVIESAVKPGEWHVIGSSDDRLPFGTDVPAFPLLAPLSQELRARVSGLITRLETLQAEWKKASTLPLAYAGKFVAPETTYRFHRGDPMQKREAVVPAAPASFGKSLHVAPTESEQSRRIAFSRWITDPSTALPARVIVNRLWHYHFGRGIVSTPSDLGLNGDSPTHPELLNWLACELVSHGWSLKHIHRLMVMSSTYRQASTATSAGMQVDAGSRLLWRYPPRRLEAEALRDSILLVSGKLNTRMGGPGFDLFEPNTNYVKVYNSRREFGPEEWRRMVYQSKPRMQLDDTFGTFDCPDAGQIAPKRSSSITAVQALGLLNSSFVLQQAGHFADRLRRESGPSFKDQARLGFRLAFGREPAPDEELAAQRLIQDHGLLIFCRSLLNANEFVFVF